MEFMNTLLIQQVFFQLNQQFFIYFLRIINLNVRIIQIIPNFFVLLINVHVYYCS